MQHFPFPRNRLEYSYIFHYSFHFLYFSAKHFLWVPQVVFIDLHLYQAVSIILSICSLLDAELSGSLLKVAMLDLLGKNRK